MTAEASSRSLSKKKMELEWRVKSEWSNVFSREVKALAMRRLTSWESSARAEMQVQKQDPPALPHLTYENETCHAPRVRKAWFCISITKLECVCLLAVAEEQLSFHD
ncbi:hypothetical protein sscle_07g057310 [Sclerotinia sclerotiorum 1980 UF-70]|uniref:Uncharacterized protein n=1 Tax=Sclerotinia sclerotiorum (strain ATCC 18683 / 1980 / Ss-1) TaxID=665079 RepID=A0A1D9Q7Q7_SCLS1|nr:hypothetical protein sscle_07g057310 [Sclerotinia sclerotiorum 1980 UF-70]